jgi:branched-chain amino acid transport system substrate-binding protein
MDNEVKTTSTTASATKINARSRRGLLLPRRKVVQTAGAAVAAATILTKIRPTGAQETGPVKIGFIEDYSGNLAVYGLQKLHAAQLAVKEIEGKR